MIHQKKNVSPHAGQLALISVLLLIVFAIPVRGENSWPETEKQFRELPMEARRLTGPLF